MGASVVSLAQLGNGVPDLLVGYRQHIYLIEVKDGDKSPSKQQLTPDEKRFHEEWRGGNLLIIKSVDEAIALLTTPLD